ncbi:MAG: ATP-binding cassette domain-containing protein [Prevotella sp.]|nr:ATP-binding cassette domain-containing protein [Prevotella sp.]
MEKIMFKNVMPQVFSQQTDLSSDVWSRELVFERGHLYLVEAASGRGKSTFCSYILGYRHDYSGSIMFDDVDTRSFGVARWVNVRRQEVSHLFQELRLFPELTAMENVKIKNNLTHHKDERQIAQWFDAMGIGDKKDTPVCRMSFGQQQRVAMIRALVQPFSFIMVDEPISHLDDENSQTMMDIMMQEAKAQGAGVIVTSIGKHVELDYERRIRL